MSAPEKDEGLKAVAAAQPLGINTSIDAGNSATSAADGQDPIQAREFAGPANPRQQRVLDVLMTGRRLTNNDVRNIGGCLNGPDLIDKLRDQGLCDSTELCMEWIKTIDRDGQHVRYGEYFLTAKGLAKVEAWAASQPLELAA